MVPRNKCEMWYCICCQTGNTSSKCPIFYKSITSLKFIRGEKLYCGHKINTLCEQNSID